MAVAVRRPVGGYVDDPGSAERWLGRRGHLPRIGGLAEGISHHWGAVVASSLPQRRPPVPCLSLWAGAGKTAYHTHHPAQGQVAQQDKRRRRGSSHPYSASSGDALAESCDPTATPATLCGCARWRRHLPRGHRGGACTGAPYATTAGPAAPSGRKRSGEAQEAAVRRPAWRACGRTWRKVCRPCPPPLCWWLFHGARTGGACPSPSLTGRIVDTVGVGRRALR